MREQHGLHGTPAYASWRAMRSRCNNPNFHAYARYGGRGIKICKRWSRFSLFFADMGPRPDGMSLDRIDPDGHYEPSNCRWATAKEQARNMRCNRLVMLRGVTMCLSEAAERLHTTADVVWKRLNRGRPIT